MPVLLEAFSVVVRCSSVEQSYKGGWDAFSRDVPNATFCSDGEVLRVGFMTVTDFTSYIKLLERRGLTHLDDEARAVDLVVVKAPDGPLERCKWLEIGFAESEGAQVMFGRLAGGQSGEIRYPDCWEPRELKYFDEDTFNRRLRFLGREGDLDVYEDRETGERKYVGRTSEQSPVEHPPRTSRRQPRHKHRRSRGPC